MPLARWQLDALRELGLEDPDPGPGGSRAKKADRELKVRRDDRDPVDPRALAGLRVLYAESPEEAFGTAGRGRGGGGGGGGGGKGGGSEEEGEKEGGNGTRKNLASGAPRSQSALEAYALRTFQASLALAIGGFPTTAREDEATLRRHEEATKRAGGSGSEDTASSGGGASSDGAARGARVGAPEAPLADDVAMATRFRLEKKRLLAGAMRALDKMLREALQDVEHKR